MFLPVLPQSFGRLSLATVLLLLLVTSSAAFAQDTAPSPGEEPLTTRDPSGWLRTYTPNGAIDHANPFFQSLGANGRSCNTCHQQHDGWSASAEHVRQRFDATSGTDPIFRPVDGADSPLDDVSTLKARRRAYSMLLTRGVIRIGLPISGERRVHAHRSG